MGRRVLLVAIAVLLASTATAKRSRPTPCAPGTFDLADADATGAESRLGASADALTIDTGKIALGPCPATGRVKARRKVTLLKARWKTCGTARNVRLDAKIAAPACDTVRGTLKVKRAKALRFTATRRTIRAAVCGDGHIDAGEPCDGVDGCGAGFDCVACACVANDDAAARTSQRLIDDARRAGTLDVGTALLYRAYALFWDPRLPADYDGDGSSGEDSSFFSDVARAWPSLDQAGRDALAPFLARPNDPASVFNKPVSAPLVSAGVHAAADEVVLCPTKPDGSPGWNSTEGTKVVVWSCGDDAAALRATVKGIVEDQLWTPMTSAMGEPKPDVESIPDPRLDVYLLATAQCRTRDGVCRPITGNRIAQAVPTRPCDGSPVTAGGYVLVAVEKLASLGQARNDLAHELFHVLTFKHNFGAQGGVCLDGGLDVDATEAAQGSWFSEASAEWASWAYAPDGDPERRHLLFTDHFQKHPPSRSLMATSPEDAPYSAFIWPFFMQQENGKSPSIVPEVWKQSGGARTPVDLDGVVDGRLQFADHFRDFAVRNMNRDDLGNALPADQRHQALEPAMPLGLPRIEPSIELTVGHRDLPVGIAPLSAEYFDVALDPGVRMVKIDFSGTSHSESLDLDVLASVKGTWERRKLGQDVFQFCRDDAADDIDRFYLVLSNHAKDRSAHLSGKGTIDAKASCCPAGKTCWTGTASVDTQLATPYGTLNGTTQASVTWTPYPQDPTGSTFQASGQVTYSATAQLVGNCTATLTPVTFGIPSYGGLLQFFAIPGQPLQYMASGSAVEGSGLLSYHFVCPDKSFDLPGDAKPWLATGGLVVVPAPGNLLQGTFSASGITYTWQFSKQ